MPDIKRYKLDAGFVALEEFDSFSKPEEFLEVSLWHNGEGFDAHISSQGDQRISLSWGAFKALKKLVKELDQ
jgi:hypothetical protein